MKIKTFYPALFVKDAEAAIKSLETFGFSVAHDRVAPSEHKNEMRVLKDAEGRHVDVINLVAAPKNFVGIRVNVEDYAETVAELEAQGYKNMVTGGVDSEVSHSTMMFSPDGIPYMIIEHKH